MSLSASRLTNKVEGITTEDNASASDFPKEYIPAIMKGIKEALTNGLVAGYPVVDVHASVTRRFLPRSRFQ